MRQLTRGSKIFNTILALPLIGLGILSIMFGSWLGGLACFALAAFLFWLLPTLTGNLKAAVHDGIRRVASSNSASSNQTPSSETGPRTTIEDSTISPSLESMSGVDPE
jgi:hypothetical protein